MSWPVNNHIIHRVPIRSNSYKKLRVRDSLFPFTDNRLGSVTSLLIFYAVLIIFNQFKFEVISAFVNLIPAAVQWSSTARTGPHHCGHRTGAVLSSDKHWHAVLEHCSSPMTQALLSVLSLAAVVSWSLSWVTVKQYLWPSHCFCERLSPNVEISGAVLQSLLASALIHCLT